MVQNQLFSKVLQGTTKARVLQHFLYETLLATTPTVFAHLIVLADSSYAGMTGVVCLLWYYRILLSSDGFAVLYLLFHVRLSLLLFLRITDWMFNVMPFLLCDRLFRCKVKAGVPCKYHI